MSGRGTYVCRDEGDEECCEDEGELHRKML